MTNHAPSRIAIFGGVCLAMILGNSYAHAVREGWAAHIPFEDFSVKNPAKLIAAEVKSLLSGATTRGLTAEGDLLTMERKPDGSTNGVVIRADCKFVTAGTWHVNQRVCSIGPTAERAWVPDRQH